MSIHFIADLHLSGDDDPGATLLRDYLAVYARAADALYVLGDLFDVWVGDDGSMARHPATLDAFARLTAHGTPVYFMRGNRDFAVGQAFLRRTGMTIVDDPHVIDTAIGKTLLTHGDRLCTDDRSHQRFRARYTDPRWRARMRRLPLWFRKRIAVRARQTSMAGNAQKSHRIMDVNSLAVCALLGEYQVPRLIHGHTHRPADHCFEWGGTLAARHVLADWQANRGEVLEIDTAGVRRCPIENR